MIQPKGIVRPTALLVMALACTMSVHAARAADPENGRKLAEQWCVSCHAVAPVPVMRDTAPPFPAIANREDFDPALVRGFIANPHPPMPRLDLTRRQMDDLVAWIASFRRK